MPDKIDTSGIPRIGVYTAVIETAALVPDTSQEVLDKAVSSMRFEIEDLNQQWLNLILGVCLINVPVIVGMVFTGSLILMITSILIAILVLFLNSLRNETVLLDLTAKVLTEEKDNVAPFP